MIKQEQDIIPLPHVFVILKHEHAGDYTIYLEQCVDCGVYSIRICNCGQMVGARGGGLSFNEALGSFWDEVRTGWSITHWKKVGVIK